MKISDILNAKNWLWLAALASAGMLAAAHGFQHIGGLQPCALCLRQREVYWAALIIVGIFAGFRMLGHEEKTRRIANSILGLVFLTGAFVAGYHAGVELKFWAGPSGCSGSLDAITAMGADLLSALDQPSEAPKCSDVPWSFAGISMAGWNGIISLILAGFSFKFAFSRNSKEVLL